MVHFLVGVLFMDQALPIPDLVIADSEKLKTTCLTGRKMWCTRNPRQVNTRANKAGSVALRCTMR